MITHNAQQPTDSYWLQAEVNKMVALSALSAAILGTTTLCDGLACTPLAPASLGVRIAPGSIYQITNLDTSTFGSLAIDLVDQIVKQGISMSSLVFSLPAPVVSGQSINYLIQASLIETDNAPAILPFFDSANPTIPLSGPGGTGQPLPTVRACGVALLAKAGISLASGTQVTPTPDPGYVGLWSIQVDFGATAILASAISQLANAPLLGVRMPQLPSWIQAGTYKFALDTGTANAMAVTLVPQPIVPPDDFFVRKIAAPNTLPMTILIKGLGTYAILNTDGTAMGPGSMPSAFFSHLGFDGSSYRLLNDVTSISTTSGLTASSAEGVNVAANVIKIDFPSLTDQPTIVAADLMGYFSQADGHHRSLTWGELLAAYFTQKAGALLRSTTVLANGTWTRGVGTRRILAFATGSGGAGGGARKNVPGMSGFSGAAAGTSLKFLDVTALATLNCTIGAPGVPVVNNTGGDGADTSLTGQDGTIYAKATGGKGGWSAALVAANAALAGPVPGVGTVGDMLLAGQSGFGPPSDNSWVADIGPSGGSSFWGGGGPGVRTYTASSSVVVDLQKLNESGVTHPQDPVLQTLTSIVPGLTPPAGPGGNYGGGGGAGRTPGAGGQGVIFILEFS